MRNIQRLKLERLQKQLQERCRKLKKGKVGAVKLNNNSVSADYFNDVPIINYNSILGESDSKIEINGKIYDGFYVSYNGYDITIYGDVTTALVVGQMQKFYILNGDHRKEYSRIIKNGFAYCMDYFKKNIEKINKNSDKL